MYRRRLSLGFIALVALILAGCGGPSGGGGGGGGNQGTGPITFAVGKDTTGYTAHILQSWNTAHPDTKVSLIELPESADQQRSQFVTNLSAKSSSYDVLGIDVVWTAEFAKSGWLKELDQSQLPIGQLLKPAVDTAMFDGKLWAAPWFTNAGLLYYRKDVLSKAGKQPPTTFAELQADCSIAKQNNMDCYGGQFAKYEGLTVNFSEAVQAAGGSIMSNSGTKVDLGAPAVQGLSFLANGFKSGMIPKAGITYMEENSRRDFMAGKLLFLRNWPYVFSLASTPDPANKVLGKFGVEPLPGFNGPGSSSLGGLNFAISAYSKHQKTAADFIKFILNENEQKTAFQKSTNPPVWASLYDDPALVKQFGFLPILKQGLLAAKPRPITPNYQEVTNAIQEEAYAAEQGQKSPDQAISDLSKKLNDIVQNG
jgi:multiple sugar transport system substrate-binding protein